MRNSIFRLSLKRRWRHWTWNYQQLQGDSWRWSWRFQWITIPTTTRKSSMRLWTPYSRLRRWRFCWIQKNRSNGESTARNKDKQLIQNRSNIRHNRTLPMGRWTHRLIHWSIEPITVYRHTNRKTTRSVIIIRYKAIIYYVLFTLIYLIMI